MEPRIQYAKTSDGIRIAYATVGEGPPLVRVLGWFTHVEFEWENPRFRRFYERLARRFTLIRYDGRGMGLSDRDVSDLSYAGSVSDLEAVVDALGVEKVALFGISQGGPTAIAYGVRHPERVSHLVVYGSAIRPGGSEEESDTRLALIRQGWGSDVPAHRQFFTGLFIPDGDMEAIQAFNEMQKVSASADSVVALLSYGREAIRAGTNLAGLLPMVAVPTLVIHRRGDAIVPFELGREIAAGIPGARFMPLDGRNHALLSDVDVPVIEVVTKAMEEFVGEGEETAPVPGLAAEDIHTILFTDIEGSTAMTQRLGDAKAREVLREHERITRECLRTHGGSEVKTMGDGFMASFGSAVRALECAIAIQRAFDERNASLPAHPEALEGGAEPQPSAHGSRTSPRADRGASVSSAGETIRVRIGLNAGEPIAEDDPDGRGDLFGTAVIRAARIAAMAHGGEILAANVVRELAEGKGFLFGDRGEVALRGFDDPVRLFEVRWRPFD